jgi:hypothetical protein
MSTNEYKDDYYRSLCDSSTEYDTVVDWIVQNNPSAHNNSFGYTPEEFACSAVHSCIRSVVYGSSGDGSGRDNMWSSTGMCIAVRATWDKNRPAYNKVVLAIKP